MSTGPGVRIRGLDLARSPRRAQIAGIVASLLCGGTGIAAVTNRNVLLLAILTVGALLLAGLGDWRWSVYGLLLYIPFSGIPIILTYPDTQLAVLVPDLLFVLPAYAGFALAMARRRWLYPGAPLLPLVALSLLVFAQAFNPEVPNPIVSLIGIKVWLFYIPLMFLGYHLVESRAGLVRLLALFVGVGLVPLLIGLVQAVAVYGGQSDDVYAWYGPAAEAVTQNYAQLSYSDDAALTRLSSTFGFVTQYYTFTASMVALWYAWWHARGGGLLGLAAWGISLTASFTSGARGAYVMVPLLMGIIMLADGRPWRGLSSALVLAAAFLGASAILRGGPADILTHAIETGIDETRYAFQGELIRALEVTLLGLGTGTDTLGARYAFSDPIGSIGVGGMWFEGYWVKAVLELGISGVVALLVLFGQMIARALVARRSLADPVLKVVHATLLGFLLWNLLYGLKGQYMDITPINVYFWLYAGLLARIPRLGAEGSAQDAHARSPARVSKLEARGTGS